MIVEAHILGSHQSLNERRSDFIVIDHHTIFAIIIPSTQQFTIGRIDLGGKAADGVLEIFDRWHITNPTPIDGIKSTGRGQDG